MSRGCERDFLILIALLSLCFYFLSIFSFGSFSGKARSTRFTWAERTAWTRGECPQTKSRLDLKNNVEFWRLMHAEMVPATWNPPVPLNLEADAYIQWPETRRRGASPKLQSCDLCFQSLLASADTELCIGFSFKVCSRTPTPTQNGC